MRVGSGLTYIAPGRVTAQNLEGMAIIRQLPQQVGILIIAQVAFHVGKKQILPLIRLHGPGFQLFHVDVASGQYFVRQFEGDAQKIWSEYVTYMSTSTIAPSRVGSPFATSNF